MIYMFQLGRTLGHTDTIRYKCTKGETRGYTYTRTSVERQREHVGTERETHGWVSKIARYERREKETARRIERRRNGERRDERKGGKEEEAKEERWSGGWFGRKVGSWMNERGLVAG